MKQGGRTFLQQCGCTLLHPTCLAILRFFYLTLKKRVRRAEKDIAAMIKDLRAMKHDLRELETVSHPQLSPSMWQIIRIAYRYKAPDEIYEEVVRYNSLLDANSALLTYRVVSSQNWELAWKPLSSIPPMQI